MGEQWRRGGMVAAAAAAVAAAEEYATPIFLYNIILRMDCSRSSESWGPILYYMEVLFLFLDVFPINFYLLKDK